MTAKLPDYRIYFEFPFENVGLDYEGPLIQGLFILQIKKHINPIFLFLLLQQQAAPILNWYQQHPPRVYY